MMVRNLASHEMKLIREIAARLPDSERDLLLADLELAKVDSKVSNGSRIKFDLRGYTRPDYKGQHPLHVEGELLDRDGSRLTVLLHVDENGRLLELELARFDHGEVIEPDWNSLRLW